MKASAISKIAAFRMAPYTCRRILAQLCCLVAAPALLALPLAGSAAARAPILTPLATELVPLGASLESPPAIPFRVPAFASPARIVLGYLTSAALELKPDIGGPAFVAAVASRTDSASIDCPNGRSPPAK